MTTLTTSPLPSPDTFDDSPIATRTAPAVTSSGVKLRDVLHSEWIRFRSVRSSIITLLAAGIAMVAFGLIFSATAGSNEAAPGPTVGITDPVDIALGAVSLTQMIVGVLGVLIVTTEYSTGLIRTSIAAVGRRLKLLGAKSTVLTGVTATVMAVAATLAVWLGQAVYAGDEATVSMADPDVWGVILGATTYLTGIALIGAALGFIFRSTAGAIGVLVGGVFIGPNLLRLLPEGFTDVVLKYLPSEAGSAMMSRVSDPDLLSTGSAYLVFGAWVLGLLGLAAVLLRNRDA